MTDRVVLVDEQDREVGEAEKLEVHRRGLLHRAFSVFAFNEDGEVLLQQRALGKYRSGGLWSNSCCSHPQPDEAIESAVSRRFVRELGVGCESIEPVGILRYRAVVGDLVENELDHLFAARATGPPCPSPAEVAEWRFIEPGELNRWLNLRPDEFTVWFAPAWRIVAGRWTGERGLPQGLAQ
jgi:isopentenyl-diphosphate delta-isomerase